MAVAGEAMHGEFACVNKSVERHAMSATRESTAHRWSKKSLPRS